MISLAAVEPWQATTCQLAGSNPCGKGRDSHSGLVSLIVTIIDGGTGIELFGFGMKPESIPPGILTQGRSRVDWVSVWFCALKLNWT